MKEHTPLGININDSRLLKRLQELSCIGAQGPDLGITRRAFSTEADTARALIRAFCEAEKISVRQDGVGNLIARVGPDGPAVVTGSHLDTVPNGGHLDGAYGVIAGLEALTCLKKIETELKRAVECIAFVDEEGRFGSMIGSKCMSGDMDEDTLRNAKDETGRSLSEALQARGMSIESALASQRSKTSIERFVELHIEQGPVLEQSKHDIGVVEEIVGIIRWRAAFYGEANHAGTTPMPLRKDAFKGLTQFASGLEGVLEQHGSPSVRGTIGEVKLLPGYMGVIPAEAHFTLDVRDISLSHLQQVNQQLRDLAQRIAMDCQLDLHIEELGQLTPTQCDPKMVDTIESLAQGRGYKNMRLPSGATHDAVPMSTLTPVGMIFVPSQQGLSHSPHEHTEPSSLIRGASLLLDTLYEYAQR